MSADDSLDPFDQLHPGDQIHQCPSKLLEVKEPNSVDVLVFASGAEQISLCLFELYLSLHELSKYKIYVNETFVLRNLKSF